jgi:CubicO group peptidase (beta-lactamase class C family)
MHKRLQMASDYSANKGGDALLVWKDSALIYENYHHGFSASTTHPINEAATLFAGLMAIKAVDDGLIKINEPVSNIVNQWKRNPQKSKITISQLIHLTSGIKAGDYQLTPSYRQAIRNPVIYPPGKQFLYGPAALQIFGGMMERKVLKQGHGYIEKRILRPIGVRSGRMLINEGKPCGFLQKTPLTARFFDGAPFTARDLGRVGILLLNNGRWKGKYILKNVNLLTKPTSAAPGYGLGVWLNTRRGSKEAIYISFSMHTPAFTITLMKSANRKKLIYDDSPADLFMAAGEGNQRLYVIPSKKLVVVRFGRPDFSWNDAEFLTRLLYGKRLKSTIITSATNANKK